MESLTLDSENVAPPPKKAGKAAKGGKKTIEEMYQKKTQLEHILLRPDTYIGSIEKVQQPMWVYDEASERIVQKEISFVPGLYKIFDEIVVNAADNKQRDPTMDCMKVTIDKENNSISVWNNGNGIPVAMHSEQKMYVPELIFGHLLTGSNFDDDEKKTTGGRNGYGAKLANIFSYEFIVETADSASGQKFKQTFEANMTSRKEPKISKYSGKDYTCITFKPDLARFKMDCLDDDTVGLLCKRVYDIAGCCNSYQGARLQVHLNGKKLPVKSFQQYISLYEGLEAPVAFEKVNDRWEVGVGPSDGQFTQVSFVNSICTVKGGQHANFVADKVCQKLASVVKRKNKGEEVKAHFIKNHLAIYVNCLIENPAFDSQTKEALTTRSSAFGSDATISDKFFKSVEKSGIIDRVLSWAKFKQNEQLKRKGGSKRSKLTGITKLDDANFAGTAKGKDATLILTEGDSAKSLAVSGLSIVGRDYYGVFPLKGKLLNVREASHTQIMKNEEIQNICKILGLRHGAEYTDTSSLRYGHLMIMADQDHDGSHIKGLLINFIHHFWPSLMSVPGFVQQFITPIVRVTKGSKSQNFYTIPEYQQWKEATNDGKGWGIKYYKGLGTSTSKDAKEYFADLDTHRIDFETLNDAQSGDIIDMAFSKKRVQDRKTWLTEFEPGTFVDYSVDCMSYEDFVNRELVLFSMADNERSIPSIMDGFKPSQRKVLFACFKRKLKNEIKVAQLAGYVSEHAAYHHGEMSLNSAIVNMAQDFVGSNNVNLLVPSGQFGTRLQGGKDAASPRYIFTCLETIARSLFHPEDDQLLTYLDDDGQSIEPAFYSPVLPMILVNGADGIGTGWSTFVPNFNPADIIKSLRSMLNANEDEEVDIEELQPWYRGFGGEIEAKSGKDRGSYVVRGTYEEVDENTIRILELPVRTWTQGYKQFLETMLVGAADSKDAGLVKDFRENHTDRQVNFTVTFADGVLASIKAAPGGLMKKMKLETTISTSNMNLFDSNGQIKRYSTASEIIREFYSPRLALYTSRKEAMMQKLEAEQSKLSNQVRFILAVISGDMVVSNRPKQALLADLQAQKYTLVTNASRRSETGGEEDEEDENEPTQGSLSKGYDYLLSMKLWSLTQEKVEDLRAQLAAKEEELDLLRKKTAEEMWLDDLDAVEQAVADMDQAHVENAADEERTRKKAQGKGGKGKKAAKKKKKVASKKASYDSDEDSDDFISSDDSEDDSDYDAPKKTKKKAAPRKPAAPKAGKVPPPAAPTAPTPAVEIKPTKAKRKVAASKPVVKPVEEPEDSDSDDGMEIMSLAERMKKHMSVKASTASSLKDSDDDDDDNDNDIFGGLNIGAGDDDFTPAPVAAKPAAKGAQQKKKAAAGASKGLKRAQKSRSAPVSAAVMFSPGQPSPDMKKPKKSSKAAAKPAAKPKAKKKIVESDDEDSDMEDLVEAVSKTPKPTRQRKAIVYADEASDFDDAEDDSEDDFEEDADGGADSEYEED
jgi:DNA topoisomerase-2